MRAAFLATALLALIAPAAATKDPVTLETLMQGMASTPGVIAEFHEVKELALLSQPLETHGHLYFIPPDRLARTTESPGRTRLVIAGGHLEFRDEAGYDRIELGSNPMVRQFVDNFIVLWSGDLVELRRRYKIDFAARARRWELVLTPRLAPVRDLIRSITLRGRGRALEEMSMVETDGDLTHTTFVKIEVGHRFSQVELERYFSTADVPQPR